jgi:hypothetical protein
MGTMIRHARGRRLATEPVLPLPVAMILPAFLTALVPPIRTSALPKASLPAARLTAIAMATIAMGADEKDGLAVLTATRPLQEKAFAVNSRRHRIRAVLDSGSLTVSG